MGFVRGIEQLADAKSIHGLYMMGHGSQFGVGSEGTKVYTAGPEWHINYGTIPANPENVSLSGPNSTPDTWTIGKALNYRLGALVIQACYSNQSNARANLLSHNGIWGGQDYIFNPFIGSWTPFVEYWCENKYNMTTLGTVYTVYEYLGMQKTDHYQEIIRFDTANPLD